MTLREQSWFEMVDVRRRYYENATWIPLRASQDTQSETAYGYVGHFSEFFGLGCVAIPISQRPKADDLGWNEIGLRHRHVGWVDDGIYVPSDVYQEGEISGLFLVLEQPGNSSDPREWHLHQDFVITLDLKREGDVWVRPDEGYVQVVRLTRNQEGKPVLLEVSSSHLRDYLCARGMALRITSYRQRVEITESDAHINWDRKGVVDKNETDLWESRISEIHEGGMGYGEKIAVFHAARTDVDPEDDVPSLEAPPTDENIKSESWTKEHTGPKLFRIAGEFWRNEWVNPPQNSPIVRGDKTDPTVFFVVDAAGNQESRETLRDSGRWLWFRPELVNSLLSQRGGKLGWYTKNTGSLTASPGCEVDFGINRIGLINVFATDIAVLPDWQQKIWAGFNVKPDGKLSEELHASQVEASPAKSHAPEKYLPRALESLRSIARTKLGIEIFRQHEDIAELLKQAHRFRSVDRAGQFALAKDLSRLTADHFDLKEIQKLVKPPKDVQWRSLKAVEGLLSLIMDKTAAHDLIAPLFAIYELRLADAHLSGGKFQESFALLNIDEKLPLVIQGYQMLDACVATLFLIAKAIDNCEPSLIARQSKQ